MAERPGASTSAAECSGDVECCGSFSLHEAFKEFSGEVPWKQIPCRSSCVGSQQLSSAWQYEKALGCPHLLWRWFEVGSPSDPLLVLLHGVCGSAANFFQQLSALRNKGFHVISLQWPAFASLNSFLCGLDEFLANVHSQAPARREKGQQRSAGRRELHLMGAELGGLLALHYAAMRPQLVKSVILCNSFISADVLWKASASFRTLMSPLLSLLPHAALRKAVVSRFLRPLKPLEVSVGSHERRPSNDEDDDLKGAFCRSATYSNQRFNGCHHGSSSTSAEVEELDRGTLFLPQESLEIKNSKEFLIAILDSLSAAELAARLSLSFSVEPAKYVSQLDDGERLLILHTLDSRLPSGTEEAISSLFPRAKVATMRSGGLFPFLAAADEVSMHVELHMRRCGAARTRLSGAANMTQQLNKDAQQACGCISEPQDKGRRATESLIDPCGGQQGDSWSSVKRSTSLQRNSSSSSMSTGVGMHQPWSFTSEDYQQPSAVRAEHYPHPATPWYDDDRSSLYQQRDLSGYPRKLSPSLLESDRNAVWERTARSCSSSSQSSSESSHSSGNLQNSGGS
ncbi:hypothetical protein Efla_005901 [Eimeria flavescens]